MKIIACCIVWNEPYFWYSLKNIYPWAAQIIVVTGAEKTNWQINASYTVEDIKDVINRIDIDNKIIFKDLGKAEDKIVLRNGYMEIVEKIADEGDLIFITDADEARHKAVYEYFAPLPKEDEENVWFGLPYDAFLGDFNHYTVRTKFTEQEAIEKDKKIFYDKHHNICYNGDIYQERTFRFMKGMKYLRSHSNIQDSEGRYLYSDSYYQNRRLLLPYDSKIRWTHYGYAVSGEKLRNKMSFYRIRDLEMDKGEINASVDEDWRYRFCKTGVLQGMDSSYSFVESRKYRHPFPYNVHPYAIRKREEIFNQSFNGRTL